MATHWILTKGYALSRRNAYVRCEANTGLGCQITNAFQHTVTVLQYFFTRDVRSQHVQLDLIGPLLVLFRLPLHTTFNEYWHALAQDKNNSSYHVLDGGPSRHRIWLSRFEWPWVIRTDRCRQFESELLVDRSHFCGHRLIKTAGGDNHRSAKQGGWDATKTIEGISHDSIRSSQLGASLTVYDPWFALIC